MKTPIDLSIVPTDEAALAKVGDYQHAADLTQARALIARGISKRDEISQFGEKIAQVAKEAKRIEKLRDFFLEPIKTIKAQVEAMRKAKSALFDPALAELTDVRTKLENLYNPFMAKVKREDEAAAEKKRKDELAAAEEAARKANESNDFMAAVEAQEAAAAVEEKPLAKPLTRVRSVEGTTYQVEIQRVEVEDISKVPAKYLLPDVAGMLTDYKEKRVAEIPGCRFYKETQTRVR